jgi:hypothetical protein
VPHFAGRARFIQKALGDGIVLGKASVKDFDGDGLIHLKVSGLVHFPHATFGDATFDAIALADDMTNVWVCHVIWRGLSAMRAVPCAWFQAALAVEAL